MYDILLLNSSSSKSLNTVSRTRMGDWAVAQSPILRTTITLDRLKRRGYESMSEIYERISPQLNEPLYTYGVALMNTKL